MRLLVDFGHCIETFGQDGHDCDSLVVIQCAPTALFRKEGTLQEGAMFEYSGELQWYIEVTSSLDNGRKVRGFHPGSISIDGLPTKSASLATATRLDIIIPMNIIIHSKSLI